MTFSQLEHDLGVVHPRGVIPFGRWVEMSYLSTKRTSRGLGWMTSLDGMNFSETDFQLHIICEDGFEEDLAYCDNFSVSAWQGGWALSYLRNEERQKKLVWASSRDLMTWQVQGETGIIDEPSVMVSDAKAETPLVVFGDCFIRVAVAGQGDIWWVGQKRVAGPRAKYFDKTGLSPILAVADKQGIFVLYDCSYRTSENEAVIQLGCLTLDSKRPTEVTWRSEVPFFRERYEGEGRIVPIGAVVQGSTILVYWEIEGHGFISVRLPNPLYQKPAVKSQILEILSRHERNPILSPDPSNKWEAAGTFNPAAVLIKGIVHLIYRAQGHNGISTFGYAASEDGKKIDYRSSQPVYQPRATFEGAVGKPSPYFAKWQSGWGWGGCEDPKLTQIGDRIYMTYVAHDGASPPRSVMTSISVEDFLAQRWNWEEPKLISPPGIVTKSACLLSEKVNGKYVMFHRVFPNILIDYLDDLSFEEGHWLEGHASIPVRPELWDSRKLSIGAPPIKTSLGWLSVYHAVDDRDDTKYKIGAMIMSLDDPAKVLWRSKQPLLSPEMWYENDWKPGIAYPSGAVVKDGELMIYYGGGDKTICLASSPLEEFLTKLARPEHAVV